jgi:hypothetical protein
MSSSRCTTSRDCASGHAITRSGRCAASHSTLGVSALPMEGRCASAGRVPLRARDQHVRAGQQRDDLGLCGDQRDDAAGRPRQRHRAAGVIDDADSGAARLRGALAPARQQQCAQERQRAHRGCGVRRPSARACRAPIRVAGAPPLAARRSLMPTTKNPSSPARKGRVRAAAADGRALVPAPLPGRVVSCGHERSRSPGSRRSRPPSQAAQSRPSGHSDGPHRSARCRCAGPLTVAGPRRYCTGLPEGPVRVSNCRGISGVAARLRRQAGGLWNREAATRRRSGRPYRRFGGCGRAGGGRMCGRRPRSGRGTMRRQRPVTGTADRLEPRVD